MRHRKRKLLALALVLALALGVSPPYATAAEEEPDYLYELVCAKDGSSVLQDGTKNGKVVLELYIRYTGGVPHPYGPLMDSGAFGLRFPKWVTSATFTPGSDITVRRIVPNARYPYPSGVDEIKKDSYHAFLWTRVPQKTAWSDGIAHGPNILLGTYTLTLPLGSDGKYQLPSKTAVGKLNWLTAAEALPLEYPSAQRPTPAEDELNKTIWDSAVGQYVGYYLENPNPATPEDATLSRIPLPLRFKAPDAWPNAFTVLSYDPKKEMTVKLYHGETLVADTFDVPQWTDTTTADTGTLYAGTQGNKDTGTGPYFSAIDLSSVSLSTSPDVPVALTAGNSYRLEISKPGHLAVSLTLKATNAQLSDCEGFPEDDAPVYLPCGDINPGVDKTGDGRIDMADRAVLMRYIGGGNPLGAGEPADLDGDGRVTYSDLSILMSPANFAQQKQ